MTEYLYFEGSSIHFTLPDNLLARAYLEYKLERGRSKCQKI